MSVEALVKKWSPVLEHSELSAIKDNHRRAVTAQLLENQEIALREGSSGGYQSQSSLLSEAAPTNNMGLSSSTAGQGGIDTYDPVLISLVRRAMPNLIAYDICGVQPMTGPTGLIFAMRSNYTVQRGTEALFNEADTAFSGQDSGFNLTNGFTAGNVGMGTTLQRGSNPGALDATYPATGDAQTYNVGQGMRTDDAENLGQGSGDQFNEMAFSIEKVTVTAKSRALKAEYSLELAQDLKAIHGLNAEAELANILSTEILAEINREVIRTIYNVAESGAQANVATAGTFDLDVDSNGRWSVEKFKGLIFQIERDANAIAQQTRRGKGNTILCSADVASALAMAGVLDYTPALNANLNVDDTGNTFAGVLQGKYRVYIDPYSANVSANQFYVVGYKGSSPDDAGMFYCPYVPLQMVRAVGENTFQPKIGFKTRYGMVANPFAEGLTAGAGALTTNANTYYRRVKVANLM
jgi:hypothetical protein